jgi:membrane-associated phospholipid phosphatase
MNTLIRLVRENTVFYIAALVVCSLLGLIIFFHSTSGSFIWLNQYRQPAATRLLCNITIAGDGLFSLLAAAVLLFIRQKKLAIIILFSFLLSGIMAQLLKNLIYAPRPRIFFETIQNDFITRLLTGSRGGASSFPSGHTTSAFSLATVLSLHYRRNAIVLLLIMLASMVGYSRIYLGHHFPLDVLAGAVIGLICATIVILFFSIKKTKNESISFDENWDGVKLTLSP